MKLLQEADLTRFLCDFLRSRPNPALFAGAGVSVRAGLPTWAAFIEHLAEVAKSYQPLAATLILDRLEKGHLLSAATTYKTCLEIPEGERFAQLARPFLAPAATHQLNPLVSLPFAAAFTTNYDRALLDSYAYVHKRAPLVVEYLDAGMKRAPFIADHFIARLHGRAEIPETMVVDEADYARAQADPDYLDALRHALTRFSCLFVGFSFLDPAISHILNLIQARFGPALPSLHVALLPDDSDPALQASLSKYNISVVHYDSADAHSVLWKAIAHCARELSRRPSPTAPLPPQLISNIQRFLGTSYARSRLGPEVAPLRDIVVDGILTRFMQEAHPKGVTTASASNDLATYLGISLNEAMPIAARGLRSLSAKRICIPSGDLFTLTEGLPNYLDADLRTLAEAVVARAELREGLPRTASLLGIAKQVLEDTLILRGWDLGAHLAGSDAVSAPPDVFGTCLAAIDRHSNLLSRRDKTSLARAVNDLFHRPDEEESQLLAEMGRLAFGLQIVTNAPAATLVHQTLLPDVMYLDASVLMPALLEGHPYHPAYVDAMSRLADASAAVGRRVLVRVGREFLNEVISHRQLAQQEVSALRLEDPDQLEKSMLFYGAEYANVFIGAYASSVGRLKRKVAFQDFLSEHAPYTNEAQLTDHVQAQGIEVVDLRSTLKEEPVVVARIRSALLSAYEADAASQFKTKPTILIEHEAYQLARLSVDSRSNLLSFFVSADMRLRRLAATESLAHLAQSILSHRALVQLVDLVFGLASDSLSITRILWSTPRDDLTIQLRDFFISRALKSFDEAQIISIPEVLDRLLEEAEASAKEEKVVIFPGATAEKKAQASAFLDRFEKRFYVYMAEEIAKQKARKK